MLAKTEKMLYNYKVASRSRLCRTATVGVLTAGSRAIFCREPCQVLTEAALSG